MDKLTEVRAVICERERYYDLGRGHAGCDGRHVACGKCDHTARLVLKALGETVPSYVFPPRERSAS